MKTKLNPTQMQCSLPRHLFLFRDLRCYSLVLLEKIVSLISANSALIIRKLIQHNNSVSTYTYSLANHWIRTNNCFLENRSLVGVPTLIWLCFFSRIEISEGLSIPKLNGLHYFNHSSFIGLLFWVHHCYLYFLLMWKLTWIYNLACQLHYELNEKFIAVLSSYICCLA